MSIVPEYNRYPGIDENNNFPPPVRTAIANSEEVRDAVAASSVVRAAMAGSTEVNTAIGEEILEWFAPQGPVDQRVDQLRNLVDITPSPLVISARGGGYDVYPENGMDGITVAINRNWVPQMQIQFLSGDIPVLIKDATTNRTMTNIAQTNVSSLTFAQWRKGLIKSPVTGGKKGRAATFDEALTKHGGRGLMMFELPVGVTPEQVITVSDMVIDRGLRRAVLFQSSEQSVVTQLMDLGIECVLEIPTLGTTDPVILYSEGVRWVMISKSTSAATITTFVDAGVKVLLQSAATKTEASAYPTNIYGFLTSDPEEHADEPQSNPVGRWMQGEAWPSRRIYGNFAGTTFSDRHDAVRIEGSGLFVDIGNASNSVLLLDCRHISGGPIERPFVMTVRFQFLMKATNDGAGLSIHLYKNTGNPEANMVHGAGPSTQSSVQYLFRRNGLTNVYQWTNGVASGANPASLPVTTPNVAPVGVISEHNIRLEYTATNSKFSHAESKRTLTTATSPMAGPFWPLLRFEQGDFLIKEVTIENL